MSAPSVQPSPAVPAPGVFDQSAASVADAERDALEALATRLQELDVHITDLRARVEGVHTDLADLRLAASELPEPHADPTALRHVALVRYDAFADVGGRLSYSVALLDDTRSGLVLTTLSGKSDVRTYVRAISGGAAEGTLTAEEQQAIDAAVGRDA